MNERTNAPVDDFTWVELGARIRTLREARGLSQPELAAAAELSHPGLYRIELGRTNPQLVTLQRIAAALGTSVRELVCGTTAVEEDQLVERVRRVVSSRDEFAIGIMLNGVETAEVVLQRKSKSQLPRRQVDPRPGLFQPRPGETIQRRLKGWREDGGLVTEIFKQIPSPGKTAQGAQRRTSRKDQQNQTAPRPSSPPSTSSPYDRSQECLPTLNRNQSKPSHSSASSPTSMKPSQPHS